ncbi:MAG: hypothetical protein PHU85_18830, partial [Phycisphaerae bacterium]|nr:hypothetical protein [Phycisphaerae bacterium]
HDDPACNTAVVLADTMRLECELAGRRGIAGGYEQLRFRFGAQFVLAADAKISIRDVRAVAEATLAAQGYTGRLGKHALDYLHQVAQGGGKLRNVWHRLRAAHDIAVRSKHEPAYTVAELDFAGTLHGGERQFPDVLPEYLADETTSEQTRKIA